MMTRFKQKVFKPVLTGKAKDELTLLNYLSNLSKEDEEELIQFEQFLHRDQTEVLNSIKSNYDTQKTFDKPQNVKNLNQDDSAKELDQELLSDLPKTTTFAQ